MTLKKIIIAIDGPAGAGKSTIARKVAARLGYAYIDTGAMYRAVTLSCLMAGFSLTEAAADQMAQHIKISFSYEDGRNKVYLNDKEVTDAIRSLDVSQNVSRVSAYGGVRKAMVAQQREMGKAGGIVMDGRDIGTVVFPQAQLKIFLTASVEERARRRFEEIKEKGEIVSLDDLKKKIIERDRLDETRAISPLKKAKDAVLIDSTQMSIEDVTETILSLAQKER